MPDFEALRAEFAAFGQDHVFAAWERLDEAGRERLLSQAAGIDLEALRRAHAEVAGASPAAGPLDLAPVAVVRTPEHGGDPADREDARRRGEALLAAGRVAALVVAGGQGSRLGFQGPKGAYPIGPVSDRSLFEIQAQKLRNLRRRTGRAIPWCVMTSPATDADTREFFAKKSHFGLPEADVLFFRQATVPSLDFEGRLLLEAPDRIFENPDGHGGSLTALLRSGVLDELEARGVDTLFYYQVDNPLVHMCDPVYLGFHEASGAEISCKVVEKTDPDEKVGIVARVGARGGVDENPARPADARDAREADGGLRYWTGNIAIHVFDTGVVRRVASEADRLLPFHASEKKIPHVAADGRRVEPDAPNGRKFERFVFDALAAARGVCVVETRRSDEFSPVKNATGADSPATARRDLVNSYRSLLAAAGLELPSPDAAIEIDHAELDGPEDASRLRFHSLADAGDVIRISSGDCA